MKQQGVILLSTLLIISIITLLISSHLKQMLLQWQAINQFTKRQHLLRQLETEAYRLVKNHTQNKCQILEADANQVITRLKARQGCAFSKENQHYRFLIETLGDFPCLQTAVGNTFLGTSHKRLTLALITSSLEVLQLRFVEAGKVATVCDRPHYIPTGVISWRYISSFPAKMVS